MWPGTNGIILHLYTDKVIFRSEGGVVIVSSSEHVRLAPVQTNGAGRAGGGVETVWASSCVAMAGLTQQAGVGEEAWPKGR